MSHRYLGSDDSEFIPAEKSFVINWCSRTTMARFPHVPNWLVFPWSAPSWFSQGSEAIQFGSDAYHLVRPRAKNPFISGEAKLIRISKNSA